MFVYIQIIATGHHKTFITNRCALGDDSSYHIRYHLPCTKPEDAGFVLVENRR